MIKVRTCRLCGKRSIYPQDIHCPGCGLPSRLWHYFQKGLAIDGFPEFDMFWLGTPGELLE